MSRVVWSSPLALLLVGCAGSTPPPDAPSNAEAKAPPPAEAPPPPAASAAPEASNKPADAAPAPAPEPPKGKLAPAEIQKVVRGNFQVMRTCYEEGLQKNPSLEGRIAVRFVIGTDGKVQSAGEDSQPFPDPAVAKCVIDAFQALRFPEPEGGVVTVVYPIRFAANADDCKTTTEEKDGIRTVSLTCAKQSMKVTDMPVKAVDDKLAEAFLTGFEQQSPKMRRTRTKPTIEGKSCWMTSVDGVTWSSMLLVTEAAAGRALVVSCLDESQGGTSAKCNTMVADIIKRTVAPPVVATPEAAPKRPLPTGTVFGGGF